MLLRFSEGRTRGVIIAVLLLGLLTSGCGRTNRAAAVALSRALQAHEQGNLGKAESLYRDVIALDPQNPFAYFDLGLIYQTQGKPLEAELYYRSSISLSPDLAPPIFNLAIVLADAGRLHESADLYRRVLELQPANDTARANFNDVTSSIAAGREVSPQINEAAVQMQEGLQASQRGDLDAAERFYRGVLRANPSDHFAFFDLGLVYQGRGKPFDAELYYRSSMTLAPGFVPPLLNLADLLSTSGRLAEAVDLYQRLITLDPANDDYRLTLEDVQRRIASTDDARRSPLPYILTLLVFLCILLMSLSLIALYSGRWHEYTRRLTNPSRQDALNWALGGLLVFLAILNWGLPSKQSSIDDAFITYRYAVNLASGEGFTFNPDTPPIQGTSTPLYTGILAVSGFLGFDVPTSSFALGVLGTIATSLLLLRLGRQLGFPGAGLAAGLVWAAGPFTSGYFLGMETPVYIAIMLAAFSAALSANVPLSLFLAALAALMRIDGLAVVAVVGGHHLVSQRKLPAWRERAPAALLLFLWLAYATFEFGSPLPASGLAKAVQDERVSGRFDLHVGFFSHLIVPVSAFVSLPQLVLITLSMLICLALVKVASKRPQLLVFIVWLVIYLAAFLRLKLPNFAWYYGPPAVVAAFLIWIALEWMVRQLHARASLPALSTLAAVLVIVMLLKPTSSQPYPTRFLAYWEAGQWLKENAPPGSKVVAYEVGIIGYVSKLQVIDLLGLTEPEARPYLANGDYTWAIREYKPRYIFAHQRTGRFIVTNAIYSMPNFGTDYKPVAKFLVGPSFYYYLFELR